MPGGAPERLPERRQIARPHLSSEIAPAHFQAGGWVVRIRCVQRTCTVRKVSSLPAVWEQQREAGVWIAVDNQAGEGGRALRINQKLTPENACEAKSDAVVSSNSVEQIADTLVGQSPWNV